MQQRSITLDALRGLAILLMVLSGSIAFGILPGWMYHAQVPPPAHTFKPDVPGITWVDLVFPFFLFSMGAAIPLSMSKNLSHKPWAQNLWAIVKRFVLLAFFAFFTMHTRAWVLADTPGPGEYWLSILAFLVLFLIYADTRNFLRGRGQWLARAAGFILAALILTFGFSGSKSFSLQQTDVIILVLANMALFGMLIWWATSGNPMLRLGILPFVAAVFLASKEPGSINQAVYEFSPFPWLYKFYYLKYLFIILPATLAGEWLLEDARSERREGNDFNTSYLILALTGSLLVLSNVIFLYTRDLELNFVVSALLLAAMLYSVRNIRRKDNKNLLIRFTQAAAYLLMLGLFFEAYEGGIKKDYSTYSYYFVCTGLAFIVLAVFSALERLSRAQSALHVLALSGRNPMIAYTAGNLLLIPLLNLTGAISWLNTLGESYAGGFLRGIIFTSLVAAITILASRKRVFWKT